MIVSFHPIIEAHQNIICAGREPGQSDLAAIQTADAVILPQGCSAALYRLACANCPHVFPNLDVRFDYAGKNAQMRLFQKLAVAHPLTACYTDMAAYHRSPPTIALPLVVKLDWGGQGETTFKVSSRQGLAATLEHVAACELSGQYGFLVQQFIPTQQRSLRVVRIGTQIFAYWRIQPKREQFGTSVASGARIDHTAAPELQAAAQAVVDDFCQQTGLQLAGFDFIFDCRALGQGRIEPLMLEVNYFFGRTGLGGSQRYYHILEQEIDAWLAGLSLSR